MLSLVTGVVPTTNQFDGIPTTTNLTAVGDKLFFITPSSSPGTVTLWGSGGGTSGAVALANIASPNVGLPSNSPPFVSQSGDVYFMSTDTTSAPGLFKTDGTPAGTTEVAPLLNPGGNLTRRRRQGLSSPRADPAGLELWESDGTSSGTTEVSSFAPNSYMINMIGQGNSVYFTIESTGSNWSGTPSALDFRRHGRGHGPLTNFAAGSSLSALTVLGNEIVFVGNDGTNGDELWATDGTPAGTTQLTDFHGLAMLSVRARIIRFRSRAALSTFLGTTAAPIPAKSGQATEPQPARSR